MNCNRTALTLVELLVVISVLVILVAILLPIFSRAKHSATETVCVSNLKQIYYACTLYEQDHGAWPPYSETSPEMSAYLGGAHLACPTKAKLFPDVSKTLPTYFNVLGAESDPSLQKAREQCIATRGPNLPALLDLNHRSEKAKVILKEEWVFVARRDGSVHRKKPLPLKLDAGFLRVNAEVECDDRLINLNY